MARTTTTTKHRTAIGTPYYAAPEVCEGKPYSTKADLWSLGCTIYELITLRKPFLGSTLKEVVKKITCGRYDSSILGHAEELRLIVFDLLQLKPDARVVPKMLLRRPVLRGMLHKLLEGERKSGGTADGGATEKNNRTLKIEMPMTQQCDDGLQSSPQLPLRQQQRRPADMKENVTDVDNNNPWAGKMKIHTRASPDAKRKRKSYHIQQPGLTPEKFEKLGGFDKKVGAPAQSPPTNGHTPQKPVEERDVDKIPALRARLARLRTKMQIQQGKSVGELGFRFYL